MNGKVGSESIEKGRHEREKQRTLGLKIATAFWAPKATKSQAPHETLFTILLHPAPMNTPFTPTPLPPPYPLVMVKLGTTSVERWRHQALEARLAFCWFCSVKREKGIKSIWAVVRQMG